MSHPNVKYVTAFQSKDLMFLLTQAQQRLGLSPEMLIEELTKYVKDKSVEQFRAYLHGIRGEEKLVKCEEEYNKMLKSKEWFKTPLAAKEAREEAEKKLKNKQDELKSKESASDESKQNLIDKQAEQAAV